MKQATIKEIREELIEHIQCDDNVITCYECTFDEDVKIVGEKQMSECEYEQALERLRQHYEDASVLHATIMNSANEVWTNCVDDKEFFNRLADATTVAEKLAMITRDNIKEIMDAFILEFKDKINEG